MESEQDDLIGQVPLQSEADVSLSDSVRALFREDAVRLYLRSLGADLTAQPIEIPPSAVEPVYEALLLVYRADHPVRDTVAPIHTFPHPTVDELIVSVNDDADWAGAWADGRRLTGNSEIDDLLQEFDLQLDSFYDGPLRFAVLRSERPLNIASLAALFEAVEGVRHAEPNGAVGDGNDVDALIEDEYIQLDYSIGWGDCPAGCINRRWWSFRVTDDGAVAYLGSRE